MTNHATMFLGLATLVAMSSISTRRAEAEPLPHGYVSLAGEANLDLHGVALSGGARVHERPIYVHAQVERADFDDISSEAIGSQSSTTFFQGSGSFVAVRAGLEYLQCSSSGLVCGVYGLDVGVLRSGWTQNNTFDGLPHRYTEERLIPRVGIDLGGDNLRARFSVEGAFGLGQAERMATNVTTSEVGVQATVLSAALVVGL